LPADGGLEFLARDEQVEAVIIRTLETTPRGATHWSTREMAKAIDLKLECVSRSSWQHLGFAAQALEDDDRLRLVPLLVPRRWQLHGVLLDDLVGHLAAAAHEVAACPQVPTPELRPQLSSILQEMVGRFALDRLHDPARREMRRDAQQQMDMLRPDVPLDDLDVERPANLTN
jgi:hypothetical protein